MTDHCFISYSTADALEFARKLANKLEGGTPSVRIWFDKDDLKAGRDWDIQIDDALKSCRMVLFAMTKDSTHDKSVCRQEWSRALSFKKPIIPLWIQNDIDVPFRLADRQRIDFRGDFDRGLAQLRDYLEWLDSPAGVLQTLKDLLLDDERDFQRASNEDKPRIQLSIEALTKQIETQQKIVDDPKAAQEQTQKNIEAGLERERQPVKPVASKTSTKFINQPPGEEQKYFQDRLVETEQVILFLKNNAQRIMTIVGRGGAGKTAMTCRLLKHIENGTLPDSFEEKHGKINVDGILYLSETGSRKINFANLFADLCRLLPDNVFANLDAIYKNPQTSTDEKTHQLLEALPSDGRIILLLDNFENVVDADANIKDAELEEALKAILHAPHHPLKVIVTTRMAPEKLGLYESAHQRLLPLDTGLASKYAKEAFLLMDEGDLVGIKNSDEKLLDLMVERTLGLPRALEALYAALRSDRYTKLEELLALPVLPENVVSAYVGEAFNRLDTNAQKVMQALAVYNRPVTPAAVDYLLAPHIPAIDSAPILQRLANMHFARKESGRFYLHPVDREFAYNLLPAGSPDDTFIEKGGLQLFKNLWDLLDKYPDLLQNQDTFNQAVQNENANIVIGSVMAFRNLDASLVEKMQLEGIFENEDFLSELDKSFHIPPIWSRYALTNRAADYFAQARKPRAEWKKLDDLSAQLAEFDLRCAAGDYDSAASVLLEIDYDYLLLWGHYRLTIELHGKLQGKIIDKELARISVGNLGQALKEIGETSKAISNYEKALLMARESNNRQAEGAWLGNLGNAYSELGEERKAIEFHEQILIIAREIGNRQHEGYTLGNLGACYLSLGNHLDAVNYFEQSLAIDREINDRKGEGVHLCNLGNAFSALGEIHKAVEYFEQALDIDRELGNRGGEENVLGHLSSTFASSGQIDLAIKYQEQSLVICKEIGNRNGEGSSLSILGSYYEQLGDLDHAKEYFEKSLKIARQTGYRYGEGFRLLNLARVEIESQNYQKAIELALQSAKIGDEISRPQLQNNCYLDICLAYLLLEDLDSANGYIRHAQAYDVPENNHNVTALHGIIALRQGEEVAARGAFVRAIGQADEILSKTAEYYSALDAKGLAISGLAICDLRLKKDLTGLTESRPDDKTRNGDLSGLAIETFRKARKIAPHAGVVKSVLRLFDELAKCDTDGILKDVRKAVEGVE